ncbi:hypothetical protein QYE76_050742 [Lolium multiflorum]|uniref:Reverse transcriptase domain-containing protein n=1 Tax=Lolium multiflorum TaxID=4521 RepID=A0AAD8SSH7_LOLMU|nr:hypothetical protein QYE76_050742 [Lolium multiflorum]
MPCLAHLDLATGKSTHTNRNRKWVNDLKNDRRQDTSEPHRPRGKGGKGKNKDKEEDSSEAMDEDDASPEPKEVVPFKSSYHVIFGRPTYHKFHARACYIYNKLKIPGPNGWITVSGDYKKARDCEEAKPPFRHIWRGAARLQSRGGSGEMQTTKKQISERRPRATYQRTMQRCLKDQIGRNVHAYVDDIAVMTRKGSDLLSDLKETFDNLRRDEVDEIAKCFLGYEVKYVRRDDNTAADMLSKLGSGRKPIGIFLEHLSTLGEGCKPGKSRSGGFSG